MRCAECSTSNSLDHKHCKECGARLDDGYRALLRQARAAEVPAEDAKAERLTQLLDMAFWHNEAGHLDAAVKACEAALSLHAENTTAHSLLGTLYEKKGDDTAAIRHFQQVCTLNPDSAADALKLDQLTRGVHVRAAAPPPVQRWIPPALASLTFPRIPSPAPGDDAEKSRKLPRWVPVVGGSVAAALVLGLGLSALHTQAPPALSLHAAPLASNVGVTGNSLNALPPRSSNPVQRDAAPVTMQPGTAHGAALSDIIPPPPYGQPPVKAAADPFAGHVPAYMTPGVGQTRIVRIPRAARVPGGSGIRALPPLSLRAVPLPGEGIAPMPVDVPADARPALPQHTVVVSSLGGGGSGTPRIGGGGGDGFSASTSSPHIRISVNSGADNGGPIVLSNVPGTSTATPAPDAGADAARLQQSALSAQQSGAYKEARSWYGQAIRAYRAQIAAGRDVDTARAGLTACQTGLAICQQQPL